MQAEVSTHSWDPVGYEVLVGPQVQWAEDLINTLSLSTNYHILDVGCGTGRITAKLASLVPNGSVIGIDNSIPMIEYARAKYPKVTYPNLQFIVMDARNISLPCKFNIVYSNATLHWFKEQSDFLRSAWQVLIPGGKLHACLAAKHNAQEIFLAIRKIIRKYPWRTWFRKFRKPFFLPTAIEYSRLLIEANFKILKCEQLIETMFFPDLESLANWIRKLWLPYIQQVPIEYRDPFIKEIIDAYASIAHSNEKGAPIQTSRLVIIAQKP